MRKINTEKLLGIESYRSESNGIEFYEDMLCACVRENQHEMPGRLQDIEEDLNTISHNQRHPPIARPHSSFTPTSKHRNPNQNGQRQKKRKKKTNVKCVTQHKILFTVIRK